MLGQTIENKYRLIADLGAGGMGAVYRAQRLLIGDEVAVKILHPEHVAQPEFFERFRREAQAAARLKHPNAVSIYDFGVTADGLVYLVMELIDGQTLRQIIKEQGPLMSSVAVEIINQACMAIGEAHLNNIIHRDIKPDNIIVNAASNFKVKVLDFGIAKLRDDTVGNLTQTGSILGTPHYMSPEQCLGEEIDHRSDIYSLGIVLYEMLTGSVPFRSPTPAAVVVQHVNQPPVPPRSLNASIPPSVQAAVLRALEKRREARPQTTGAFASELASAVAGTGSMSFSAVSADGSVSMPTIVIGGQSFQGATRDNDVSQLGTPVSNRAGVGRVIVLTALVTAALLAVGGLTVGMLLRTSNGSNSTVNGSTIHDAQPEKQEPQLAKESTTPVRTKAPPVSIPSREILGTVFTKNLRGTIGKYGVEMVLLRNGNNLSGTYVYTKYRTNISLTGSIDANQNVEMYGYDNGVQIDVFKGRFVSSFTVQGQWSKPNGSRSLPFTLTQSN